MLKSTVGGVLRRSRSVATAAPPVIPPVVAAGGLGEVEAGAEGAARAGQDHHAHIADPCRRRAGAGSARSASAREMVFIRSGRLRVMVAT
jgi:hypothetical protein